MVGLLLLVGHDVENEVVRLRHTIVPDAGEVVYGTVDVFLDNAFGAVGTGVLHRQESTHDSGGDTTGDLEGTARFGSVTNHAGDVGNHVLDGIRYLCVVATHEVGDAYCRARGCHHAAAECGEATERLLDVDDSEIAEGECAERLLFRAVVLLCVEIDGYGA